MIRRIVTACALLALVAVVAISACGGPQRQQTECAIAHAADGALDTIVGWVVGAVLNGTTASPELTRAVDAIEDVVHATVPAVCPRAPAPASIASMRLRAAIASHPAPRP